LANVTARASAASIKASEGEVEMAYDGTMTPAATSISIFSDEVRAGLEGVERRMARFARGGTLGEIAQDHLMTPGKRVRARLALAAAASLGADMEDASAWAAAVEMVHNASLIHDDLQDGDRVRRGVPTTWVRHGEVQAINAGDLLLVVPYRIVGETQRSGAIRWALCDALSRASEGMARGQAEEPGLIDAYRSPAGFDPYLRCISGKTGALFAAPVEGAALIAGRDESCARQLAIPFSRLGELFQMQDDVLDLYGDKGREQRGNDLREGKVSSLVVAHLHRYPHEARWLLGLLETPREETSAVEVREAIARFADRGALDDVLARIRQAGDDVLLAPALAREPALAAVAHEMVHAVLRPIRHLLDARGEPAVTHTTSAPS
jgi:geranylgeranyl diphosphate synthase type I